MREIVVGGRPIDAGPTVFTMRWVFEALFATAGESLDANLTLHPATTLARHSWGARDTTPATHLDLFADRERSAAAIGEFAGAKDAAGYLAFCEDARRIYEMLEEPFIRSSRPTPTDLVGTTGMVRAMRLKPFTSMWRAIGAHMKDPRLQQLFGRYATYCGTSPYTAPATLMLVAHVEQEGVWLIEGGMHRLAQALADVATRLGVVIRYDCDVREITTASGRVSGVRLHSREVVRADAVVMNGEPTALAAGLLGSSVKRAALALKYPDRSLSATTWSTLAHTSGLPLLRHNVFFSRNYKLEFDLIREGLLPTEPTVYICAQDRGDSDDSAPEPGTPERLLMLVNAPASGDRRAFSQVEIDQCMQGISGLLQRCGMELTLAEPPVMTTPATFHRLFPSSGGALYGAAVNGGLASFRRPENRTVVPGLYLAGGSTHPGAGVPMAALSGRLAAASLIEDMTRRPALTRLFRPNGYAWWYVDALSDDGAHGITLIAFIGSVFSPWYAWARRRGPADPQNHVSPQRGPLWPTRRLGDDGARPLEPLARPHFARHRAESHGVGRRHAGDPCARDRRPRCRARSAASSACIPRR